MICDRVAIIVGGKILSQGRLTDLISEKILFTEVTISGSTKKTSRRSGKACPPRPAGRCSKSSRKKKSRTSWTSSRNRKGKSIPSSPGPRPWKTCSWTW